MHLRTLILAIGAASLAGGAAAQSVKAPLGDSANAPKAKVVLASAEELQSRRGVEGRAAEEPIKRKVAARATTCRCAPVQDDPEPQDQ